MPYQDKAGRIWSRSSPQIRQRAKELRQSMTQAENRMWQLLRDRQLAGMKFRRQHPLGPFIVDFYCADVKLIVEIDGEVHFDPIQKANDEERDAQCRAQGYTVLRFTNRQVMQDVDSVLEEIVRVSETLRRVR